MPVPKPEADESQNDFMERCMAVEGEKYPNEQALAICMDQWSKKSLDDLDILLEDIRRVLKDHNLTVAQLIDISNNLFDEKAHHMEEDEEDEEEASMEEEEEEDSKFINWTELLN